MLHSSTYTLGQELPIYLHFVGSIILLEFEQKGKLSGHLVCPYSY